MAKKQIKLVKSKASFFLKDVNGFIYGGTSSKFWMFRKHFNHLDDEYYKGDVPFFPWECITIQLPERDVYLIIKDENLMEQFIKLLIYHMQTVDGNKGSSRAIEHTLYHQYLKEYKDKGYINKKTIIQKAKHKIMTNTMQKYRIIKIRQKISFIAFSKCMTITELFYTTILDTYQTLLSNNQNPRVLNS